MSVQQNKSDLGFIGLGVMGANLVLNLADNGFTVAGYDLDKEKVQQLLLQDEHERMCEQARVKACDSFTELLHNIASPRIIFLSVPAGEPVDHVCRHLIDAGIEADDIVVDTGNSLWTDSVAREQQYQGQFIFFSTAVSGGEVGARFGPSLMPSGDPYAWSRLAPVMQAIAAKVDEQTGLPIERTEPGQVIRQGEPCATYIGPLGAGHYVKMVHNGIEYADMQLICEAYHVMREVYCFSAKQIADIFRDWNKGELNSYLIEISAEVLEHRDPQTKANLVDLILDRAGQKGTGLWTAISALQVGAPAQTIAEAVFARSLSALKSERVAASQILTGPAAQYFSDEEIATKIEDLRSALYCAKICVYAQGFQLMEMAAKEHGWQLDFAAIAKIWRAGCIIRAAFLQSITEAYQADEKIDNLLLAPYFVGKINTYQNSWRRAIADSVLAGIPCSALSSAIAYYDAYRTAVLPANLLQGQRDYFGAHTFERTDKPTGQKYHVEWTTVERNLKRI